MGQNCGMTSDVWVEFARRGAIYNGGTDFQELLQNTCRWRLRVELCVIVLCFWDINTNAVVCCQHIIRDQ